MAPLSRPHVGEPLALDLLNTEWMAGGEPVDFLTETVNVATWLADNHLDDVDEPATAAVGAALVEARGAIRAVLTDGGPATIERLNAVLTRGAINVHLDDGNVIRTLRCDNPAWRPAVLAAHNLVDLIEGDRSRIRRCEHPDCVLWFHDTSRNGTRRWHSMASCGNRAKAQRHYARSRTHKK